MQRYGRFVRRWLPLLLFAPLLGGVAGYMVVSRIPSTYQASVTMLVQPGDAAGIGAQDFQSTQDLAQTYAEALHTRRVLTEAATQVGLGSLSERDLGARVQARKVAGTQLLRVSVDDTDPSRAAAFANAVADVFLSKNAEIQANRFASSRDNLSRLVDQLQADIDTRTKQLSNVAAQPQSIERDTQLAQLETNLVQVRASYANTVKSYEDLRVGEARAANSATVFDPAVAPEEPVRPNRSLTTVLAIVAGLIAACGIALLAEYFDDGLRDPRQFAGSMGLTTLAYLPRVRGSKGMKRSLGERSNPELAQSHRLLRGRLMFAMGNQAAHSLMIASPATGEGKSTVAANLAIVLAEGGQRVILVDADFHRPTQMELFALPNERGLSTLLMHADQPAGSALGSTWLNNLHVLTCGPVPSEPSALLSSKRLEAVLAELRRMCDVVVVDSPPLLAGPDGALLSPHVDAVLVVLDAAGRTRRRQAVRGLEMLHGAGANVLGVVVNRASSEMLDHVQYASLSGDGIGPGPTTVNGHGQTAEATEPYAPTPSAARSAETK